MNDTINIFISGDFAPTHRVLDVIQAGEYQLLFNDILPLIKSADIAITNLEVPLIENGTPIKKTGPNLKAPEKSIDLLKFAGFNMVTLANNHIMDYGWEGLKSTLDLCKINNLAYIGAGEDLNEAQTIRYIKSKGKTIAFINVAENEWSTTHGEEPGANPLNEVIQYYQITEARQNSDHVILIIHGGHETYGLPSPRMRKLYRYFIDLGVDAVVGHHTHCFSGHEVYKEKPIIYSLGNFIFDKPIYRNNEWNKGCAVTIHLQDDKVGFNLIPYMQCDIKVGIKMLNEYESSIFLYEADLKTKIIQNDRQLEDYYIEFVDKQSKMYLSFIELSKNKYILAAINRGILPRTISKYKKRLLLNLIKTEAHRDVLLSVLKQ